MMSGANMFKNLCRLCLGADKLLYIFDDKMADNMAEIIEVTSGVQISKSDTITQMVCSTCCQITIKMYKFRTTSIKNDKELKARFAGYNIAQLSNSNTLANKADAAANVKTPALAVKLTPINPPPIQRTQQPQEQKYKFAHSSIKEIIKKHPNIKLPEISLKSHFGACITLLSDEVDEWFKGRNISDDEISLLKKIAYEQSFENIKEKVSRKRSKISYDYSSDYSNEDVSETSTNVPTVKNKRLKLSPPNPVVSESKVPTPQEKPSKKNNLDHSTPRCKTSNGTQEKQSKSNLTEASVSKLSVQPRDNHVRKDLANRSLNDMLGNKPSQKRDVPGPIILKSLLATSKEADSKTKTNGNADSDSDDDGLVVDDHTPESDSEVSEEQSKNNKNNATQEYISARPNEARESESGVKQKEKKDSKIASTKTSEERKHEEINNKRNCEKDKCSEIESAMKPLVSLEDYTLFTTRPFVKSANKTKPSFKIQMEGSNELLILSDSEDYQGEVIQVSGTGSSSQSVSSNERLDEETAKTSFVKSLELEPRDPPGNQPDLLLVSANRSYPLFVCKICDSHHTNLKDLKHHEKKNHTKCPFCNKKFRTLAHRDEHVKENCGINNKASMLKTLKLNLVRVDEDDEIRRKYSRAFDNLTVMSDTEDPGSTVSTNNVESEQSHSKNSDQTKPSANFGLSVETTDVVQQLEKLLKCTEWITRNCEGSDEPVSSTTSLEKKPGTADNPDIICISDEENESLGLDNRRKKSLGKVHTLIKNLNILNVLKDNNLNESDVIRVVKNILTSKQYINTAKSTTTCDSLRNSLIIDGKTSKVKIFKNLRKHLQHYKIPIEVKYNPSVVVEYKTTKAPTPKTVSDLWTSMVPQQLNRAVPTTQVSTASVDLNGGISNHEATTTSSLILSPTSTIYQPQTTSSPQLMPRIMSIGAISNSLTNQLHTPAVSQLHSTTPFIINATQNICNSTTNNTYTNIILLPGSLLKSPEQSLAEVSSPLPVIESVSSIEERTVDNNEMSSTESLPHPVSNGGLQSDDSVSTTEILNPPSNHVFGTHPAIRVKNLSELS